MDKLIISEVIFELSEFELQKYPVEQLIKDLSLYKDCTVTLTEEQDWDGQVSLLTVNASRLETDMEFEIRKSLEFKKEQKSLIVNKYRKKVQDIYNTYIMDCPEKVEALMAVRVDKEIELEALRNVQ